MSLFGSLFTGVSGLTAQSQSIAAISDNVANVNTTGFKLAEVRFSSLVLREPGSKTFSPGGVITGTSFTIGAQGLVQSSGSPTDVAIVGKGFFVVNAAADGSGKQVYTRSGNFVSDASGNLVTPTGFYLQGWRLDANGSIADVNKLETVNTTFINGIPFATSEVSLGANLDAAQAPHTGPYNPGDMATFLGGGPGVEPHFSRTIEIYDSLGNAHDLTIAFLKSPTPNVWNVEVVADATDVDTTVHPNGLIASGLITFGGDGTLAANGVTPVVPGVQGASITWLPAIGADPSDVVIDLGELGTTDGLAQFATPSSVAFTSQNGAAVGFLDSVSIDERGYVIASLSNGGKRPLYRLALATFPNPAGLEPRTGSVYELSLASGEPVFRGPGEGGVGKLQSSALEASNVDIANEFTKMIVTQRAYSANARVVSTADEMLDELIRLRR